MTILTRRGHKVQLLDERDDKGADLYLPKEDIAVEVKCGIQDEDGWACTSFGRGKQITKKKFDYCVFVVFNNKGEGVVKRIFVFTRDELEQVHRPRRGIAAHLDTNPCLLMYAPSFKAYRSEERRVG